VGGHRSIPIQCASLSNIVSVSGGNSFSACVDYQGRLWLLGDITIAGTSSNYKPRIVSGFPPLLSVYSGENYILCIDNNLHVWGMGENTNGQLGLPEKANINTPQKVSDERITSIACSGFHSILLNEEGFVLSSGTNHGQLGLGNSSRVINPHKLVESINNVTAVACCASFSLFLTHRREVYYSGLRTGMQNTTEPTLIPNFGSIVLISCANDVAMCVDDSGSLWVFGQDQANLFGIPGARKIIQEPTKMDHFKNVSTLPIRADNHIIIKDENGIWAGGHNQFGQLGLNNTHPPRYFTRLNDRYSGIIAKKIMAKSARK